MISDELFEKYNIDKDSPMFKNNELGLYQTFLIQTADVLDIIAKAQYLGEEINEDYTEVIRARQYAREQIRILTNS